MPLDRGGEATTLTYMSTQPSVAQQIGSRLVALGAEERAESVWLRASDAMPSIGAGAVAHAIRNGFRAGYQP